MPFIIILIGVLLVVAGVQGTLGAFGDLLVKDFTGKNSFGVWLFALFIIGAIGYIPKVKPLSDAFLLLVIVGIVFANDRNVTSTASGGGFLAKLQTALTNNGGGTINAPVISADLNSGGIFANLPTQAA